MIHPNSFWKISDKVLLSFKRLPNQLLGAKNVNYS